MDAAWRFPHPQRISRQKESR